MVCENFQEGLSDFEPKRGGSVRIRIHGMEGDIFCQSGLCISPTIILPIEIAAEFGQSGRSIW